MPPEVRRAYERLLGELGDKDKDGIPDIVQHAGKTNVLGITKTSFTINGKTYDSVDQMPAEVKALYDKAMAQAGAGSGISASLGPGGKSPGAHVSYTYAASGGGDQVSSSGSRALFLLLLGAMLGGVVVYLLLK